MSASANGARCARTTAPTATLFPHDHARSRAYRWGEDGLGGFCDERQRLCLGVVLWNGADPILKERLFGLTNGEGNHGEDVKEIYYYLDATPTYSYARMLYKYPQAAFPYQWLIDENGRRGKLKPEFELIDTGIFDDDAYFDVDIQYAKADVDDILLQIRAGWSRRACRSAPKKLAETSPPHWATRAEVRPYTISAPHSPGPVAPRPDRQQWTSASTTGRCGRRTYVALFPVSSIFALRQPSPRSFTASAALARRLGFNRGEPLLQRAAAASQRHRGAAGPFNACHRNSVAGPRMVHRPVLDHRCELGLDRHQPL